MSDLDNLWRDRERYTHEITHGLDYDLAPTKRVVPISKEDLLDSIQEFHGYLQGESPKVSSMIYVIKTLRTILFAFNRESSVEFVEDRFEPRCPHDIDEEEPEEKLEIETFKKAVEDENLGRHGIYGH